MQNLLDELTQLLQKDDRFTVEGQLLKNKVIEAALQLDPDLLKLLLSNKSAKKHFFQEVDGIIVFDKAKFQKFISNKTFLPNSYTAFKNKIGLTSNDEYILEGKEVVLSWPYKDCILEGGQTKEKEERDEIFWNETLAPDEIDRLLSPKVFTNFKKYNSKGEHKVTDISLDDNLIIRGNNLLALHSLLPIYRGRIKLIYIDPPYNTGSDKDTFIYNNNFKHSTWLTFMKNRLEIAKDFLQNDGFIAISIDHTELYYLGTIADEIFSRENRVGLITVLHNPKGRNLSKFFSSNSEFLMVYARNIEEAEFNQIALDDEVKDLFDERDDKGLFRYEPFMRSRTVWSRENKPNNWYPIYVSKDLKSVTVEKKNGYYEIYPITPNGKEMAWKKIKKSFIELNKDNYFIAQEENGRIIIKHKLREQQVYKNVWLAKRYQSEFHGTNLLKKLLGTNKFSYPKSVYLIKDIIKLMAFEDDIVLDFFAGSGTTAQAVLDLNKEDNGARKFILCEQMDYIEEVTKERSTKVITNNKSGSFNFCELSKLNQQFITDINSTKSTKELKQIWEAIKKDGFISYKVNPKEIDKNISEFDQLSLKDQKAFLIEVLDKNHLYVNYSEIDDMNYKISEEDKRLNKKFYSLK